MEMARWRQGKRRRRARRRDIWEDGEGLSIGGRQELGGCLVCWLVVDGVVDWWGPGLVGLWVGGVVGWLSREFSRWLVEALVESVVG